MIKSNFLKLMVSGTGLVALSGCSLASMPAGYSPIEQQAVQELSASNYTPRSADERAAILTQDLFAQAAFWSRKYDLNPVDLEAAINLASTLRRLGNPHQSIEVAQTTRALYPRDVDLMAELAAALIADNNPKDALPIIDTALVQRPNMARLWSLKGAALDQFEQFSEARQHYSKGLSLAPNNPGIIANVGLSYALEGDPQTAEIWLRRAANMPGANASTRQNLSLVLGLQNKFEEAEKWARRDLDQQTVDNNMSYIRTLRGSSAPTINVQKSVGQQTNREVRPIPAASIKSPYGQTIAASYLRPKPGARPHTKQPYVNPYQQPRKISSPVPRLTNYGQMNATNPDKVNMVSARDAALAAAKRAAANPYVNTTSRPQTAALSPEYPAPQGMATQDVLGRIARNNTSKAKIAKRQQQELTGRVQMQQPPQQPVQQYVQPYPNGQPATPYGVTVPYPDTSYPPKAQVGAGYDQSPQSLPEPPASQPARQRRR